MLDPGFSSGDDAWGEDEGNGSLLSCRWHATSYFQSRGTDMNLNVPSTVSKSLRLFFSGQPPTTYAFCRKLFFPLMRFDCWLNTSSFYVPNSPLGSSSSDLHTSLTCSRSSGPASLLDMPALRSTAPGVKRSKAAPAARGSCFCLGIRLDQSTSITSRGPVGTRQRQRLHLLKITRENSTEYFAFSQLLLIVELMNFRPVRIQDNQIKIKK